MFSAGPVRGARLPMWNSVFTHALALVSVSASPKQLQLWNLETIVVVFIDEIHWWLDWSGSSEGDGRGEKGDVELHDVDLA